MCGGGSRVLGRSLRLQVGSLDTPSDQPPKGREEAAASRAFVAEIIERCNILGTLRQLVRACS